MSLQGALWGPQALYEKPVRAPYYIVSEYCESPFYEWSWRVSWPLGCASQVSFILDTATFKQRKTFFIDIVLCIELFDCEFEDDVARWPVCDHIAALADHVQIIWPSFLWRGSSFLLWRFAVKTLFKVSWHRLLCRKKFIDTFTVQHLSGIARTIFFARRFLFIETMDILVKICFFDILPLDEGAWKSTSNFLKLILHWIRIFTCRFEFLLYTLWMPSLIVFRKKTTTEKVLPWWILSFLLRKTYFLVHSRFRRIILFFFLLFKLLFIAALECRLCSTAFLPAYPLRLSHSSLAFAPRIYRKMPRAHSRAHPGRGKYKIQNFTYRSPHWNPYEISNFPQPIPVISWATSFSWNASFIRTISR